MEPHMIENYISLVFVIFVSHVGFMVFDFDIWTLIY